MHSHGRILPGCAASAEAVTIQCIPFSSGQRSFVGLHNVFVKAEIKPIIASPMVGGLCRAAAKQDIELHNPALFKSFDLRKYGGELLRSPNTL